MKGFFIKDVRLMLQQKRFFIVLILVSLMLNFSSNSSFAASYLPFVCSFFVLSSISYDEIDNCYPFLLTLPASRKTYVIEKYVFSSVICISAWLIGLAMSLIAQYLQNMHPHIKEFLSENILIAPIILILISVMIPFVLKFGNEKGRIVLLIVLAACFAISYALVQITKTLGISLDDLIANLMYIARFGQIALYLVFFLIAIIILFISTAISIGIMEKKEF